MLKRVSFVFVAFFLCASLGFSHGKKDTEMRSLGEKNSWQEDFDLTDKKEGKYNILITADDKGGNTQQEGAFNIFIDPESDLPVAGITNPLPNMRVPGNLNIVGSCVDDDAVASVEVILDGDKDNPIKTEGKEFWSYYLDTTQMTEGPHTVEVYGTDINGLVGHTVKVTWHLDRHQPETKVENYELGALVSGKIDLKGTVSDGNGIQKLEYSTDGGESYTEVKVTTDNKTGVCSFSAPIETTKFEDGPAVCWFRATDGQGSVGVYSFLYFIDNTKPDVAVVSPQDKEIQNGKFGVAGYAKDKVGIQKLSWQFAGETGDFELIPGNPYWFKEIDTTGKNDKSCEFTIIATDTAGNTVVVKKTILLNQELDKPVATITYPLSDTLFESSEKSLSLRGFVTDDDALYAVEYSLDNDDAQTIECTGGFCVDIPLDSPLEAGKHTVKVTGVDVNGVRGNPAITTFMAKGTKPTFSQSEFDQGQEVHPEAGAVFSIDADSGIGIKAASYILESGNGKNHTEIDISPKSPVNKLPINIPLKDTPYGILKIIVNATDIYDRTSTQTQVLNIQDLSQGKMYLPQLVFEDSLVDSTGLIVNDGKHPVTGFFYGGKIKSAEFTIPTDYADLQVVGDNFIKIIPPARKIAGVSPITRIKVTTEDRLTYESKNLKFVCQTTSPKIELDNPATSGATLYDASAAFTVTGKVTDDVGLSKMQYTIYSALVNKGGSTLGTPKQTAVKYMDPSTGAFKVEFSPDDFENGLHLVEFCATNGCGKKAYTGVVVTKTASSLGGKPQIVWFDKGNVYAGAFLQGTLSEAGYKEFLRDDFKSGVNNLEFSVAAGGAPVVSKYAAKKASNIETYFTSVGEKPYMSGMPIVVPLGAGGKDSPVVNVQVLSDVPVTSVSYKLSGVEDQDAVFGGQDEQEGKAVVKKISDLEYEATFSLANLPARYTKIEIKADNGINSSSATGIVSVIRQKDPKEIDNSKAIYWTPLADIQLEQNMYVMENNAILTAYANVPVPVKAEVTSSKSGLKATLKGNVVEISATEDGYYTGVVLHVTDMHGAEHTTAPISLMVDSSVPQITLKEPSVGLFVQDRVRISGVATDGNGIQTVDCSIDDGSTWLSCVVNPSDNTFTSTLSFADREDGLVGIDVRAKDKAGRITMARTCVVKDATPPEIQLITPMADDIVNGENRLSFIVKDNGKLVKAQYVSPTAPRDATSGTGRIPLELAPMISTLVGTKEQPIHDAMGFEFTDAAGNVASMREWQFVIDAESDLPISEIHLPLDNAVITKDFEISGVIYDDDGPCKIYYKIDDAPFTALEGEDTSFSVQIPLLSMTDNEHSITVYAEDIHGVKGPETVRPFRVSLEEPKGAVLTPEINKTVKETVTITGAASDKNGIQKVQVSLDNGNTYNDAIGTTEWSYTVDTRVIQDGTHVVFVKIFDGYDIEGICSSLVNIDNTPPRIALDLPLDGSSTTGAVFFSGETTDNIALTDLAININNISGGRVSDRLSRTQLTPDKIITQVIDLSSLDNGFYNIELTGKDAAGNATRVSRNIELNKQKPVAKVDLLYPLNGEHLQGQFNIYGTAISDSTIDHLDLYLDGKVTAQTTLSSSGYFMFTLNPELIQEGEHEIQVRSETVEGKTVLSNKQYLSYSPVGAWVTIDNFTYGDFAIDRPYIRGQAGYALNEQAVLEAKAKGASDEVKQALKDMNVAKIEISFNNGKTFKQVSKREKWRYRVENEDIEEGYHFLLLRATMKNGETAITRTIVQVDKTKPTIRLISPGEGGRYNQNLEFSGLTRDDIELKDVKLYLRKGDKAAYEVPGFIQGLYFDWHFWGATLFDFGMGLTFFDDNVKVQVQWGQFTQSQRDMFTDTELRYGGDNVWGMKILANVGYIPLRYYLGPDWDWLSATFAIGANFTRFNETASGKAQILSALLGQIEFPRVTMKKRKFMRTFSVYTEFQLWFIPTDVSDNDDVKNLVFRPSVGFRLNLF